MRFLLVQIVVLKMLCVVNFLNLQQEGQKHFVFLKLLLK